MLVRVMSLLEIDASEKEGGSVAVAVCVEAAAAITFGDKALGSDRLPRLFAPGLASALANVCAAALSLSDTLTLTAAVAVAVGVALEGSDPGPEAEAEDEATCFAAAAAA